MTITDNKTIRRIGLMSKLHTKNKNYINRTCRLHKNCSEIIAHHMV